MERFSTTITNWYLHIIVPFTNSTHHNERKQQPKQIYTSSTIMHRNNSICANERWIAALKYRWFQRFFLFCRFAGFEFHHQFELRMRCADKIDVLLRLLARIERNYWVVAIWLRLPFFALWSNGLRFFPNNLFSVFSYFCSSHASQCSISPIFSLFLITFNQFWYFCRICLPWIC